MGILQLLGIAFLMFAFGGILVYSIAQIIKHVD